MGTEVDDAYLVQRAREGYVDAYADLVDRLVTGALDGGPRAGR